MPIPQFNSNERAIEIGMGMMAWLGLLHFKAAFQPTHNPLNMKALFLLRYKNIEFTYNYLIYYF